MKKINIHLSLCFLLICSCAALQAQPFFGFQSIGRHSLFFSIRYDVKPQLGVGYIFRAGGGTSFTDWSAEWSFPVDEPFQTQNSDFNFGFYTPINQKRRPFFGFGMHARIHNEGGKSQYGLAVTGMPSQSLAGVLSERPYSTLGLRLTYHAVMYEKEGESSSFLPQHGVEVGGHVDGIFERSLGLSLNGFAIKKWKLLGGELDAEDQGISSEGNFYFAPTYNLRRW